MDLLHSLNQQLECFSGRKLKLKINDNRSTMLSVRWESDCTKVSLHRIFLEAPEAVMQSLARYINRERKILGPLIKAFIENNIRKYDYSSHVDEEALKIVGEHYHLKEIYDELNEHYFAGALNLKITWYGYRNRLPRKSVALGLYYDSLKLIKVHRLLDRPRFPRYVISFVIYHEMLHAVCPSYVDDNGLNRIHHSEFKIREAQFEHFERAQKWIAEHRLDLFT